MGGVMDDYMRSIGDRMFAVSAFQKAILDLDLGAASGDRKTTAHPFILDRPLPPPVDTPPWRVVVTPVRLTLDLDQEG